jgi:uncharacterized protein YcbX
MVPQADIGPSGIVGDRRYALIDAVSGRPAAPEIEPRWRKALHLRATLDVSTTLDLPNSLGDRQLPRIAFPDGASCGLDDASLNARLSDYFSFAVSIAAYARDARLPAIPAAVGRYQPAAMHLLTTASIRHLATLRQAAAIDSRRFRPTVLIDVPQGDGFVESNWIGRPMRLGEIALTAREETKRCGMTFAAQPGLDEDPEILRAILRHNKRNLGIYCAVGSTGTIRPGDPLFVD